MSKSILIAGAGANQIGVFETASSMGITTVAVDGDQNAAGFGYADHCETANILDKEALVDIARRYGVDGIYPAAELSVEAVSRAASQLNFSGIPPEVAICVRNKMILRRTLDDAGIANPRYRDVRTREEARSAAGTIGFPCIIKPSDANSSKGVQQLRRIDEVEDAFAIALKYSLSDSVLIEEYMPGEEFCVDGLVYQGRYIPGGITGKEVSPLPYRFDKGIFMPPMKSIEECEILESCARDALEAIGFTNGTFHLEIIVTPDGPRIVEIAGRPGGGRIPTDLIPMVYGMDFMADSIRIALGEAPESERQFERGVALYWFEAEPGTVSEIRGVQEASALPGVKEIVFHANAGDALEAIIDCVTRDKIGYVLAEGSSAAEAKKVVEQARAICKVITT